MSDSQGDLLRAIIPQYDSKIHNHDGVCQLLLDAVLALPNSHTQGSMRPHEFGACFCFMKLIMSVGFLSSNLPLYEHGLLQSEPQDVPKKKAARSKQQQDNVEAYEKKLRETYDLRSTTCDAIKTLVADLTSTEVLHFRRELNETLRSTAPSHPRLHPADYAHLAPKSLVLACINNKRRYSTDDHTAFREFKGRPTYIRHTGIVRKKTRFTVVLPGSNWRLSNLTLRQVETLYPKFTTTMGQDILTRVMQNPMESISVSDGSDLSMVISCVSNALKPNSRLLNVTVSNPNQSKAIRKDIKAANPSLAGHWTFPVADHATTVSGDRTLMQHRNVSQALQNNDGCVVGFHKHKAVMFVGVAGGRVWCPQLLPNSPGNTIGEFRTATQDADGNNLINTVLWCCVLKPPR